MKNIWKRRKMAGVTKISGKEKFEKEDVPFLEVIQL